MKLRQAFAALLAAAMTAALSAFPACADWESDGGRTYYRDESGGYATGWQTIDGKKYYFRKSGIMVTKSAVIDGVRYKFASDGACQGEYTGLTGSAKGRKYWRRGKPYQNRWIHSKSGKRRYYAGEDGYLLTGKAEINGEIFEFNEKCRLVSGERKAPIAAFFEYKDFSWGTDQYIFALDADGYYYYFRTEDEEKMIDPDEDGWYEKMLKIKPIAADDKLYREADGESLKLLSDFSEKLEEYAALPMYRYHDSDDDGGICSAYCVYRDKDGVFKNVLICCRGERIACRDSDEVMRFVNMMSQRTDMSRIFAFHEFTRGRYYYPE